MLINAKYFNIKKSSFNIWYKKLPQKSSKAYFRDRPNTGQQKKKPSARVDRVAVYLAQQTRTTTYHKRQCDGAFLQNNHSSGLLTDDLVDRIVIIERDKTKASALACVAIFCDGDRVNQTEL